MTELDAIELLIGAYAAPAVGVGFLVLKGVASILNNNISTKRWPEWLRGSIDWLASADKRAKETGDSYADSAIEIVQEVKKSKRTATKLLKLFS